MKKICYSNSVEIQTIVVSIYRHWALNWIPSNFPSVFIDIKQKFQPFSTTSLQQSNRKRTERQLSAHLIMKKGNSFIISATKPHFTRSFHQQIVSFSLQILSKCAWHAPPPLMSWTWTACTAQTRQILRLKKMFLKFFFIINFFSLVMFGAISSVNSNRHK